MTNGSNHNNGEPLWRAVPLILSIVIAAGGIAFGAIKGANDVRISATEARIERLERLAETALVDRAVTMDNVEDIKEAICEINKKLEKLSDRIK